MTIQQSISFKCSWSAPSNIALIKYWGKRDLQFPINPSLSLSLDKCKTITSVEIFKRNKKEEELEFYFEEKRNSSFEEKVKNRLEQWSAISEYAWIKECRFVFYSKNTFPHSAGIASSASSFASIALLIQSFQAFLSHGKNWPSFCDQMFFKMASNLARIGSGSASRSLFGGYVFWGENKLYQVDDFNCYAASLPEEISENFNQLQDSILILSDSVKSVSSSEGHQLMNKHHFKEARIEQANLNFSEIISAMKNNDWDKFSLITENEAMTLHGLMMSSIPSFILMSPETVLAINILKRIRETKKIKVTFTLDAGPNLHIIFPKSEKFTVKSEILDFLLKEIPKARLIHDQVGAGPELISND